MEHNNPQHFNTPTIDWHPVDVLLHSDLDQYWQRWWQQADQQQKDWAQPHITLSPWAIPWAASPWLAELCIQNPTWLQQFHLESQKKFNKQHYLKRWHKQWSAQSTIELMQYLRLFHHYEIGRICYRDFNNIAKTAIIGKEISALAEAVIEIALDWHYSILCKEYGTPTDDKGNTVQLGIIGMGKLGGHELNLCSDVDLIPVYKQAGQLNNSNTADAMDNQAFFERLVQNIIETLSTVSENGRVWIVDLRLRPYGNNSQLTNSFDAIDHYYQTQGRDWERYAMSRARAIAGDIKNTHALVDSLRPFVYRRYLDFKALQSLRTICLEINNTLDVENQHRNIKLGTGGIREAEFSIQFFQMVYGGKHPSLRHTSLFITTQALVKLGLLSKQQEQLWNKAYCFLRDSENAIQAYALRQTHLLPQDSKQRAALASAMGFSNWDDYTAILSTQRNNINALFQLLIMSNSPQDEQNHDQTNNDNQQKWQRLWRSHVPAQGEYLDSTDQADNTFLSLRLKKFLKSRTYQHIHGHGWNALNEIMPVILQELSSEQSSEAGIDRFLTILEKIAMRDNYLILIAENPPVLKRLIELCQQSPFLARQLEQQPILLDELLDSRSLYQITTEGQFKKELQNKINATKINKNDDNMETIMLAMQGFQSTQLLRITAQDLNHLLTPQQLGWQLSALAKVCLDFSTEHCSQFIKQRYGKPGGNSTSKKEGLHFCIIGYGKLGAAEMSYTSDLDLVFLYDAPPQIHSTGEHSIENAVYYNRLTQRILGILKNSQAYDIDLRLRPSGNAGVLISHIDAFERYHQHKAWIWEHQALIPARAISGDQNLVNVFETIRHNILIRNRDKQHTRDEVLSMRQRMDDTFDQKKMDFKAILKHYPGGLVDLNFLIQYLVLCHAQHYPKLTQPRDSRQLLKQLNEVDILTATSTKCLENIYNTFSAAVNHHTVCEKEIISSSHVQQLQQQSLAIWNEVLADKRTL